MKLSSKENYLKRIAEQFIALPYPESCYSVRYGGEEFLVVLMDCPSRQAEAIAEALMVSIRNLQIPHPASKTGYLTVSAGIHTIPPAPDTDPELLVRQADRALYTAKNNGKNCCVVFKVD